MKRLLIASLSTLALTTVAAPAFALTHPPETQLQSVNKLNERFQKEHQQTLGKLNQRFQKEYQQTLGKLNERFQKEHQQTLGK